MDLHNVSYKWMVRSSIINTYFPIYVSYKAIHFCQHYIHGTRIQSVNIQLQKSIWKHADIFPCKLIKDQKQIQWKIQWSFALGCLYCSGSLYLYLFRFVLGKLNSLSCFNCFKYVVYEISHVFWNIL